MDMHKKTEIQVIIAYTELSAGRGYISQCPNCEHWDKKNEVCSTYNQRPPATVIANGCPEWLWAIPF